MTHWRNILAWEEDLLEPEANRIPLGSLVKRPDGRCGVVIARSYSPRVGGNIIWAIWEDDLGMASHRYISAPPYTEENAFSIYRPSWAKERDDIEIVRQLPLRQLNVINCGSKLLMQELIEAL